MEIRFTINAEFIKGLQKDLDEPTATEIARSALSLLNWAVKETKEGRVIVSSDRKGDAQHRLAMPILDQIKHNIQQPDVDVKATAQPTE
jgi:hypothetical protein